MELNSNPAIETKEKRLIPRWLAISAVVLSTISLLISALALVSIADSEEEEVNQLSCSTLYEVITASLAVPVTDTGIWKMLREAMWPKCDLDWADIPTTTTAAPAPYG